MTHMCDGRNFFPRLSLASSLVVELMDVFQLGLLKKELSVLSET